MLRRATYNRAEGQAIVLAALAFVLLVAFLGLALDGANAFGQSRRVRNVADAAALAGARELIAQKASGTGGPINQAIEEFIEERNDLDGATWQAFYVPRLSPDTTLGPVQDGARPPAAADGVRVEINVQFNTYFMGVFGQRTLGVGGNGTAIYGPLGTAIGQDLAPIAISQSAYQELEDEGEIILDLRGYYVLAEDWYEDEIPDNVFLSPDIKHVSFRDVAGAPTTGDDCLTPGAQNLTAWWCQGSPIRLRINRELPAADPANGTAWHNLREAIQWREDNRPILVLPVYVDTLRFEAGNPVIYHQLVQFVAVELVDMYRAQYKLTIRHLPNYATAGATVGEGSGVSTGVWAVNLTR